MAKIIRVSTEFEVLFKTKDYTLAKDLWEVRRYVIFYNLKDEENGVHKHTMKYEYKHINDALEALQSLM